MDKKDWMQKYFLEYRENKRWCIDTSKGSVSRLDMLKDKCTWTKPGFDWHPSGKVVDERPRHERFRVTFVINSIWTTRGETPDYVIKAVADDYLRDIKAALRNDRHITDIQVAGYELCSDS